MSGRVIAVSNRKGGTAKTTTTVNLAAALGDRGWRVLVVDLDSQGHAGFGFGVKVAPGQPTVHDVFRGTRAPLTEAIQATVYPNVDVLPADRGFDGLSAAIPPRSLATALRPLIESYRVVLIDTAPTADALLISALASAHHVLIPTTLHHLAIDGVGQFARSFFRVATTVNADLHGLSILPVQLDLRMTMQRDMLGRLISRFGRDRLLAGIRPDIALAEAFGRQQPVKYFKPRTRSVEDFEVLCDYVISRIISD
ncbi:ParA family protein [Methylorubrum zatmanii]|uniref:ParA family protein n=1 Tax=Methylorubrum zatmanii TaxID=29429 RepID=A0ABW1WTI3_9HYPH|nr:ParA family protein [Methylorubrum zatmanii]MBD8907075.1 hypothetical protein [Methylorubrum zatmanii]